jgi:hypothetical protein
MPSAGWLADLLSGTYAADSGRPQVTQGDMMAKPCTGTVNVSGRPYVDLEHEPLR